MIFEETVLEVLCRFPDDDVVTTHLSARANYTVGVQFVVGSMLAARRFLKVRLAEFLTGLLGLFVSSEKGGSEETAVDG